MPGAGIRVVIELSGSGPVDEQIPAAVERLAFRRSWRTIPLGEVPPVLLAESYADYVHFAEAGDYDPDWEIRC